MYGKVILLADRTLNELGVDVATLSHGSNKKIIVECTSCHETMIRQWKDLHNLHSCPIIIHKDNVKLKHCSMCNEFLPLDKFSPRKDSKTGFTSWCVQCATTARKTKKDDDINYWFHKYFISKKSHAKQEGIKFTLDEQYLIDLWYEQAGRCFYTNLKLRHNTQIRRGGTSLLGATLDRRNPNGGYVPGNVVWCSWAINALKSNSDYTSFTDFMAEMALWRNAAVRLECKLIHPDAKIPDRKRDTDAGLDLYAIEDITIPPNGMVDIRTGVILACPKGYYFTVEPRSSLWTKGITPFHGIIDATYTGELMTALTNFGKEPYHIKKGDRVAQIILQQCANFDITEVSNFSPDYDQRGTAGFGESGR